MLPKHEIEESKKLEKKIDEVWNDLTNRHGKWGDILTAVTIENIRGISATMEFKWPITVIGGTNRSGKTTFLQACSLAYQDTRIERKNFRYPNSLFWSPFEGETQAFNQSSKIQFKFQDTNLDHEVVYKGKALRYARFGKRAHRRVEFRRISDDQPRGEGVQLLAPKQSYFKVQGYKDVTESLSYISAILGVPFEAAKLLKVATMRGNLSEVPLLVTSSISYSEKHMGAGEQKIFHLVNELDGLPEQSLILLEEPEVTLHPDVHRRLALYFIGLCFRRKHQIILTTHSPAIFRAFPRQARVFLSRSGSSVQVEQDAEPLKVERELAGSVYTNKDIIFVEDETARIFLEKILERFDRFLREQTIIVPIGDQKRVLESVDLLKKYGVRVVSIRDPDVGEDLARSRLALPGGKAIECLLLENENRKRAKIDRLEEAYIRSESKCSGKKGTDYSKCTLKALSRELDREEEDLIKLLVEAWLQVPQNSKNAESLVMKIRNVLATA